MREENKPMKIVYSLLLSTAIGLVIGLQERPAWSAAQKLVVPAYFADPSAWTQLTETHAKDSIVIADFGHPGGPGKAAMPISVERITAMRGAGHVVVGYVDTDYGKRTIAEMETEIKQWFTWYHVGGIFLDETTSSRTWEPSCRLLSKFIRARSRSAVIIINPGTQTDESYMADADIVCNYEGPYDTYLHEYSAPAWVAKYPALRFWQIVYDVPQSNLVQVLMRTRDRNAGYVYVTSLTGSNPYRGLPDDKYWSQELRSIARR